MTEKNEIEILGGKNSVWFAGGIVGFLVAEVIANGVLYSHGVSIGLYLIVSLAIGLTFICGALMSIQTLSRLRVSISSQYLKVESASGEWLAELDLNSVEEVEYTVSPTPRKYGEGPPYRYTIRVLGLWGSVLLGEELDDSEAENAITEMRKRCPGKVKFNRLNAEPAKTFLVP